MKKILVTGGCGYIGGHTIVDLIEQGYDVISIDNLSRGNINMLYGIEEIVNRKITNYRIDLCDLDALREVFEEHDDIAGIIHFAAFKSVPESVDKPLLYYYNNNTSLINLLQCCKEYNVKQFIFSSSCSVYGNVKNLPVTEDTPLAHAESPYAATKVMGEQICKDFARSEPEFKVILLRYFNPVGAHPSAIIGEMNLTPENLVPVVTQTAIGKRANMSVFGNDYNTRDGSCIRDYIHVMDIATAHTLAINKLINGNEEKNVSIYNLGSGSGVTVLELIEAFEKVSNQKLNYEITQRRQGDVVEIYANNNLVRQELNWEPKYDIEQMMKTAWDWELALQHKDISK